jgi:hypothetical protein
VDIDTVADDRLKRAIALMMEAVHTSETSIYYNVTTRRFIPEDSTLLTRNRENLKSGANVIEYLNKLKRLVSLSPLFVSSAYLCLHSGRSLLFQCK